MSEPVAEWTLPAGFQLQLRHIDPHTCTLTLAEPAPRGWLDKLWGRAEATAVRARVAYLHALDTATFDGLREQLARRTPTLRSTELGECYVALWQAMVDAGFAVREFYDDNVHSARILEGLVRVASSAGRPPGQTALDWYVRHHGFRARAFATNVGTDFHVGDAVWDDDWVFNVASALARKHVDPIGSLVVLVCADPREYSAALPDETVLQSLGALSGDIVHFVWMLDRHGHPSLQTKLEIVDALRDRGIQVDPEAAMLLLVTLRQGVDRHVVVDVEGTLSLPGGLSTDDARKVFVTIVDVVRKGRARDQTLSEIVAQVRLQVAAVHAVTRTTAMLEWFRRVIATFFSPSSP